MANRKSPLKRSQQRSDSHAERSSEGFALSNNEKDEVEEKRPPRAAVLHEIIRREGEQELSRTATALGLSAIAAGLSMGFSMLARALLHRYLGGSAGGYVLENLGYSVGFIIVILARQQLFTENTMTAVLPLMTQPSLRKLASLLRLWLVVLVGNLIGVALFSAGILHLQQIDAETENAIVAIGTELMRNSVFQMFTKGILAGWLVATMVWLLGATENSKLVIIIVMTTLIAVGGFTHIIVGSAESLYLVFAGHLGWTNYLVDFALPTLSGNIFGGSLIFALISHAQVRSDVE